MKILIAAIAAGLLMLTPAAFAEPVDVGIEVQHDNGTSVLIRTMEMTDTEIRLDLRIVNGHNEAIRLAHYDRHTYIDAENDNRLMLVRPEDNHDLEVPAQSTVEGSLVFFGPAPDSGDLLVMFNEPGARGGATATVPRITLSVPSEVVEEAAAKKN